MAQTDVPTLMGNVLSRHPSVIGSRYDQETAAKQVDIAKRQFYPTPSIGVETLDARPTPVFRLTQPIWTGGQLTGQLQIAQLRNERAALLADDVRIRLALKVLDLCQNYENNSRRIDITRRSVLTLTQLTAMIARRTEAEVSSVADRRVAEARLSQAQADLEGFMAARTLALRQLEQLNGTPIDMAAIAWRAPPGELRPLPDYLTLAAADWPANRVARVDALVTVREAEVAVAARWPTVSLALEHRGRSAQAGLYPNNDKVMLQANYTLGAGLSTLPQAEAAQSRALAAEQGKETAERQAADAIVMEWQALQSASARRQAQSEAYQGAQDILESNRRLFVAGRRSWIDVVNSVREATQAEIAQAEIETVLVASRYRLELLAGRPVWLSNGSMQ